MELLLLIGGVFGLYLYNLSQAAKNLVYFPSTIIDMGFDNGTPFMQALILVQNTSNTAFTVRSIAGNVTASGTLVGNVSDFVPTQIPPNSEAQIPITIRFQMLSIVDDIISAFKDGHISKDVEVLGHANVNGFQEEFSIKYHLGI